MSPRRDDITVSDLDRGDEPRIVAEPTAGYSLFAKAIEDIDPSDVVVSDEELFGGSRSIAALVPRTLRYGYSVAIDVTVPSTTFTVEQLVGQIGPLVEAAADSVVD
jgi:DNA-binding IclR family transcriptional regulator